jgi:hypothetical protein
MTRGRGSYWGVIWWHGSREGVEWRPEGIARKEREPMRKGMRDLRGVVVCMGAREGEEVEKG